MAYFMLTSFLVLSLSVTTVACGGRVNTALEPSADDAGTAARADTGPSEASPQSSFETLRTDLGEACAFGAGAGYVVWIDKTRSVRSARAEVGSSVRTLGRVPDSFCALSVYGTRVCFGDAIGGLSCVNVDGTSYRKVAPGGPADRDPVRAVSVGPEFDVVYARGRAAYGSRSAEPYFGDLSKLELAGDAVAVASFAVATSNTIQRIPDSEPRFWPTIEWLFPSIVAMRAASFETDPVVGYNPEGVVVLGIDGAIRYVKLGDPKPELIRLVLDDVKAFVNDDRHDAENFFIAGGARSEIVAFRARLPTMMLARRVLAEAQGAVVGLAIDGDHVLWATDAGAVRRVRRLVGLAP